MAGGQGISPVPPGFKEGKSGETARKELAVTSALKHQSVSLILLNVSLRHKETRQVIDELKEIKKKILTPHNLIC